MPILSNITWEAIFENVLGEFVFTIIAVIVAQLLINKVWYEFRYGRWHLTIIKNGEIKINKKKISTGKMKQINEIPEELSVYLKGICSPFHRVQCDIIEDGPKLGLYTKDNKNREIIIDLDKDANQVPDDPSVL
jgi:hypothetical protein